MDFVGIFAGIGNSLGWGAFALLIGFAIFFLLLPGLKKSLAVLAIIAVLACVVFYKSSFSFEFLGSSAFLLAIVLISVFAFTENQDNALAWFLIFAAVLALFG